MTIKKKPVEKKPVKAKRSRNPGARQASLDAAEEALAVCEEAIVKMKAGRPTKLNAEKIQVALAMLAGGATDAEVCDAIDICIPTLWLWRQQHPAFSEAIKLSKDVADDRVEASLFKRAVGYEYDSEKILQFEGEPIRVQTRTHVTPSDTAAIFWLKNRRGWRDKQEITGLDGTPLFDPTPARDQILERLAGIGGRVALERTVTERVVIDQVRPNERLGQAAKPNGKGNGRA